MKLLLLSALILSCAARDHSMTDNELQGTFNKETFACSLSSEQDDYCERPQTEETLKRLTEDGIEVPMQTVSAKEEVSAEDFISTEREESTNEEELKFTAHIPPKVRRDNDGSV